jgi:hypothetical protein
VCVDVRLGVDEGWFIRCVIGLRVVVEEEWERVSEVSCDETVGGSAWVGWEKVGVGEGVNKLEMEGDGEMMI